MPRPTPGRLTLGEGPGKRLLATEAGHSLLVLGPTQSGKTSGLAIPAILEWPGPVVATSVKADLLKDTIETRRSRGEVWVYDPSTTVTGVDRSTWTRCVTPTARFQAPIGALSSRLKHSLTARSRLM